MKKTYISGLFVAALVALFAFPSFTEAAKKQEDDTKKPASPKCGELLVLVNGHARELEDFKNRHYGVEFRNITDPKIVEVKKTTVANGDKNVEVRTGRVKVPVYQKGGVLKDTWVKNYEVILQRHELTVLYFTDKLGAVKADPHSDATDVLRNSISNARGEINGLQTKWAGYLSSEKPNCANKHEGAKVRSMAKERTNNFKKMKTTRDKSVEKKSSETSKAYRAVANNADNKKILRPKKPKSSTSSQTGGAQAPN